MTLNEQFGSLGLMVLMGVWIGASFSVYQRFIHPHGKKRWILFATDPVFWIIQALLLFALLLPLNEGVLRFYLFLGVALGFSFYKWILEKPFLYLFDGILAIIVQLGRLIGKSVTILLLYPLYFLLKLVYRLCRMTVNAILKILLFLLVLPLKIFWWMLRLFLPGKWVAGLEKKMIGARRLFVKWLTVITRRR
ncbi:spore cortex biosynthesis protein YabQ [Sporolactobacillus shoreae]|uniref:Spore cortex biosynthesis protein YabQ n=1 Tax=Sporolactobacillus shoreae TaxID=1465501 RepID=A0A4Z0GIG0_9BACL|nr:spore cortex biosynthesis protein YabQ [Sporolactobacillus shoreae]TGA96533.1 spore cortex biosynthesis protein YabQ [Sporolactobacillus shoreae]